MHVTILSLLDHTLFFRDGSSRINNIIQNFKTRQKIIAQLGLLLPIELLWCIYKYKISQCALLYSYTFLRTKDWQKEKNNTSQVFIFIKEKKKHDKISQVLILKWQDSQSITYCTSFFLPEDYKSFKTRDAKFFPNWFVHHHIILICTRRWRAADKTARFTQHWNSGVIDEAL